MRVREVLFPLIYGALTFAILTVWTSVLMHHRYELKRLYAWLALGFTTGSCAFGVWGLFHLTELQKRYFFDFHFERSAASIAYVGFVSALVWVNRSHRWWSWVILGVATCFSLLWTAACATL